MSGEAPEVTDELIDTVMEYIGKQMRKSHIKLKLREDFPDLKIHVIERLIKLAKQRIIEVYKVNPEHFKGCSIEFYASVLRDPDEGTKYKLIAQQRLDAMLGLENITSEDPTEFAQKVQDAMREMDETVADK
jgi:hypothetical protein